MDSPVLPSAWLRGLLDLCLLGLLGRSEDPVYGYELMRRLEGAGIGPVPGGSLYPALLRLEKQGYLSSQWQAGDGGPGRKYYALTPEGSLALAEQTELWHAFSDAVDAVLEPVPAS